MAWRKSLHGSADGGQIITMPTRAAVSASPLRMHSGYDRAAAGKGGGGTDMSGVRADLAEQTGVIRGLVAGFGAELRNQARTIQTMQRQMVGA
jgi:hypothetical protein